MSEEMTREQFEEWIENHKDEAVARVQPRGETIPLGSWLASFYNQLRAMAAESTPEESNDEDEDGDSEDEL